MTVPAGAAPLFALALLLLAGCRTIEGTYGVPPFYEVYPSTSTLGAGAGKETYYRPFTAVERSSARDHTRASSFPPFLDLRWEATGHRYWVLPVFFLSEFRHPLGPVDLDWTVFPFFFGGHDPREGSYFAVLPFYGNLKGLLVQDEMRFVLFPLYLHQRAGERQSLHILWPFYNRVWGGDWTGGRLWPFYGRYQSFAGDGRLRYDREFVAWPFYSHRLDEMNVNPTELSFFFPFYGERKNQRTLGRTYLWPFYQYHHDRRYDRTTHMGFLLAYRFTEGQTDFWPFFGVKKTNRGTDIGGVIRRTYRQYIVWPIERYSWATDGLGEETRFWLLPLLWHFHYIDRDSLETRNFFKVWPLFSYSRAGSSVKFDFISPLIFWAEREGWDRYYSRWFEVFRYRSRPELSGWEVLYGAIMYRREPARREKLFSILGGLFECGTRDGDPSLRLLYLPWRS
jgi:hypothetical protein